MEWQPIETLDPKCAMFLSFHPRFGQRIFTVDPHNEGWFYMESGHPTQAATHWMPLPEPPK